MRNFLVFGDDSKSSNAPAPVKQNGQMRLQFAVCKQSLSAVRYETPYLHKEPADSANYDHIFLSFVYN